MNIKEEKNIIVRKIISESDHTEKSSENLQVLYDLLMRGTNAGKLYKYRSFDQQGFSLSNLETGTLHCSVPSSFNDPFDCKIGITMQTIVEAPYEPETRMLISMCYKIAGVFRKQIPIETCSPIEIRIINRIRENQEIIDFLRVYAGLANNDEEAQSIVEQHQKEIKRLISLVLTEAEAMEKIPLLAKMYPDMTNSSDEPINLLKEHSQVYVDIARANGIINDDDEMGLSSVMIRQHNPELSERTDHLTNMVEKTLDRIFDGLCAEMRIGCLCTDSKNRLMWSHYADCHTGFCIEYDYSGWNIQSDIALPMPVIYSSERPIFPGKCLLFQNEETEQIATKSLLKVLLTKDNAWEYENEWRLLCQATEDTDDVMMPPITHIYLGAQISHENEIKILKIAREKKIPVMKMKLDRGAYELHACLVKVDDF